MDLGSIGAVTVTYNPPLSDGRFALQLRALRGFAERHVVVDNGSRNSDSVAAAARAERPDVEWIPLGENRGVGRALNAGIDRLSAGHPTEWALLFDQDTTVSPSAIDTFRRETGSIPDGDSVGAVAFNYIAHRFNRTHPHNPGPGPRAMNQSITSGTAVRTHLAAELGFDERLFLYYTDVDFCHRLRESGRSIMVLDRARIDHQEGLTRGDPEHPRFYLEPSRLFFITRNGLAVAARYGSAKAIVVAAYLTGMNLFSGASPTKTVGSALKGIVAYLKEPSLGRPPNRSLAFPPGTGFSGK